MKGGTPRTKSDHDEMHHEDTGLGIETREQGDGSSRVDASEAEVIKACLPHLLVRLIA